MTAPDAQDAQKRKLLGFLGSIPLFSDLSDHYKGEILSISRKITLDEGGILCKEGEQSVIMFILISGRLSVKITNSATISTIVPYATIGELGVFTGEPRSASVHAVERSVLLAIKAADIHRLIDSYPKIGVLIMRKVIETLRNRIQEQNVRIREFQEYIMGMESK